MATFNVENLDALEPQSKFDALAGEIVTNMRSPDVISLEEIQDNNGATNDAVVDADQTYAKLIAAIQSAGGPTYDFRQINPVDDQDGGEPGGNIRVGFLFRTDRGLTFVDRPGGGPTTPTTVVNGRVRARAVGKPGSHRPDEHGVQLEPQAARRRVHVPRREALHRHEPLELEGRRPAPVRPLPAARPRRLRRNATSRRRSSTRLSTRSSPLDADANVVVLGRHQRLRVLGDDGDPGAGGVLHALMKTLPQSDRYSYVFEGNSQSLDHIVVTTACSHGRSSSTRCTSTRSTSTSCRTTTRWSRDLRSTRRRPWTRAARTR